MPQLRTFSAYTKNANAGLNLVARQCTLANIDGNYITGAAGQYFQIHDKATAPINTDVPIKSFYLASAGPINLMSIYQILGPIRLTNGLAVAISSTEATLTLSTGSFDVFGEVEDYEPLLDGLTTGSATDALISVWNNAAGGSKRLYDLKIVNNEGTIVYPFIFAYDSVVADNSNPYAVLPSLAIGQTRIYTFGSNGIQPFQIYTPPATYKYACTVQLSTSGSAMLLSPTATSVFTARYK